MKQLLFILSLGAICTTFIPNLSYSAPTDLDPDFGENHNGIVITDILNASIDDGRSLAIQSDGKIVVVGSVKTTNADFAIVRYNSNGTLDTDFGGSLVGLGGKATIGFTSGSDDEANSVAIDSNGKILVVGTSTNDGKSSFALARLNSDGKFLDLGFGTNGRVTTDIGGGLIVTNDKAFAVALQSDGQIVVAGSSQTSSDTGGFILARYNKTDGSLDNTFGSGGAGKTFTLLFGTSNIARPNAIALQNDGKIVAAGCAQCNTNSSDFALARYTQNGGTDSSFGTNGQVTTDLGGIDETFGVAIQGDGKIVAAGVGAAGGGKFALVRYCADGKLDDGVNCGSGGFGTGGKVITSIGNAASAHAIAIDKNGKIVVAGGANGDFALVRYNSEAALISQ
jgi:uncharacterized delta-60 repeat protein